MNDRTISLNAVNEIFKRWIKITAFCHEDVNNLRSTLQEINELPPVTPNKEEITIKYIEGYNAGFCYAQALFQKERTKGYWIYEPRKRLINETDNGAEYITDYWCKCSECGGDFGYIKVNDAYCKFCGADMRGDKNG